MFGYYVVLIFSWLVTIAIGFIVIRKATRADEQISLLKNVIEKQEKLLQALAQPVIKESDHPAPLNENYSEVKSDDQYLLEARKKAGLL